MKIKAKSKAKVTGIGDDARQAEAAKTSRLRALRLAKETADKEAAARDKEAAAREAAAGGGKRAKRRVAAAPPADQPAST